MYFQSSGSYIYDSLLFVQPSNEHLKVMLIKKFSKALPDFLATFQVRNFNKY